MKSKRTIYLGILCTVFIVLNIFLLIQNLKLKHDVAVFKAAQKNFIVKFPKFVLPELIGTRITPGLEKLNLFILFSPTDCAVCLEEAKIWEMLNKQFSKLGLRVVGIADHTSRQELDRYVKIANISFPVYLDHSTSIKQQLNLISSPAKVLVDKDANILKLNYTEYLPEKQQEWYKQTYEFITNYFENDSKTNN